MTLSAITDYLASIGCELPDIELLQPADPFLDTTGEDLRRRVFITQQNSGAMLCLRPEFTIPVCLSHLRTGEPAGRYGYGGAVFRQRTGEPQEFTQAGFEDFGNPDRQAADVDCISTALSLLASVSQTNLQLVLGDQRIFLDLLRALEIPPAWQKKLLRNFGDMELLQTSLKAMASSSGGPEETIPSDLLNILEKGGDKALEAEVRERMLTDGLSLTAGRTPLAIAARLAEKAQLAASRLDGQQLAILQEFLAIDVPLENASEELERFEEKAAIDLSQARETLIALTHRMSESRADIVYRAGFGRRLDYYTGLVFEIFRKGLDKPLIGGGRYDHLMTLLGSPKEIPAVGFAIWVDRLEAPL